MRLFIAIVEYVERRGLLLGAWPIAKATARGVITLLILAIITIARIFAFEDQVTPIGLLTFFNQSWLGIVVAWGILGAFGLGLIDLINKARQIARPTKINNYLREMGISEKDREICTDCELVNAVREKKGQRLVAPEEIERVRKRLGT
jgi:hypothetical protein